MTKVAIEHCVSRAHLDCAIDTQPAIPPHIGRQIGGVRSRPGTEEYSPFTSTASRSRFLLAEIAACPENSLPT